MQSLKEVSAFAALLLAMAAQAVAQAPVSGLPARKAHTDQQGHVAAAAVASDTTSGGASTEDDDKTRIAAPAGAGAAINDGSAGAAGPLIGFQVWKLDKFLLSTFFTFAPTQELTGGRRDFGSFLLAPPGRGTSFTFAASRVFPLFCAESPCTANNARLFVGPGIRAGVTNTTWKSGSGDTATSVTGSVGYITPSVVITSKTYSFATDTGDVNEYQMGFLAGYGLRNISGDLAHRSNAEFRRTIVGTDRTTLKGPEFEFFVRMNAFRPFFRYSRFKIPGGTEVPGLSSGQVVFGVDVLSSIFTRTLK